MCGICGILSLDGRPVDLGDLHAMTEQIVHRGPDDSGVYRAPGVGFGFRRLSIVDLSAAGHQPMTTPDGRYTIVYNGEVYNHRELHDELAARGVVFHSKCDTEVVLQAFVTWGIDCVERLHGMFAFAVHDTTNATTWLARDRFGIKPLYYAVEGRRLTFASEIGALLPVLGERSVNQQMVFDYLVHDRIDHTEQTFYRGVLKLSPGHWMKVADGDVQIRQWYDLRERVQSAQGSLARDGDDVNVYRERFAQVVKTHAISEVPLGVSLSGGIDSSAIVGMLLRQNGGYVDTFSAVYGKGQRGDESEFIDAFTPLGSVPHFVTPSAGTLYDDLQRFTRAIGEPSVRTGPYAQFKVMELASRHVTVMLDGQGADEILAGYPNLPGHYYHALMRRGRLGTLASELRAALRYRSGAIGWQTALLLSLPRGLLQRLAVTKCHYVDAGFARRYSRDSTVPSVFYGATDLRSALIAMTTHKLQHLLKWTDHNSMHFSIESRVPFLDHTFVEATLALPGHAIIERGMTKSILRRALRGLVPDAILERRDKIGFGTPEDEWFRQPALRDVIRDAIESPTLRDIGAVDIAAMRGIFDRHMARAGNDARALWKCLHLHLWLTGLRGNPGRRDMNRRPAAAAVA
ncbi:asparagine synthase (glutamine-hydrolyzing) [Trinickia soli]|uniref:asparagine synthase (glutamine-hydrolyzing) n=1 Tax=Trinickia soli TaxID=380675 RepID=UPI003FA38475